MTTRRKPTTAALLQSRQSSYTPTFNLVFSHTHSHLLLTRQLPHLAPPRFLVKRESVGPETTIDDDAAEASHHRRDGAAGSGTGGGGGAKKRRGQNKARKFHWATDEVKLCQSLGRVPRESLFASTVCEYAAVAAARTAQSRGGNKKGQEDGGGEGGHKAEEGSGGGGGDTIAAKGETEKEEPPPRCAFVHDLREYLKHKAADIGGVCPAWQARGECASGWKCRWLASHCKEDGGELVLVTDEAKQRAYEQSVVESVRLKMAASRASAAPAGAVLPPPQRDPDPQPHETAERSFENPYGEIANVVPSTVKMAIRKDRFPLARSREFIEWHRRSRDQPDDDAGRSSVDPPPRPEEKRRLYIGRETPLLAPLTCHLPNPT